MPDHPPPTAHRAAFLTYASPAFALALPPSPGHGVTRWRGKKDAEVARRVCEALRVLQHYRQLGGRGDWEASWDLSPIIARLGKPEVALDFWAANLRNNQRARVELQLSPIFDFMRGDPRFDALLSRRAD